MLVAQHLENRNLFSSFCNFARLAGFLFMTLAQHEVDHSNFTHRIRGFQIMNTFKTILTTALVGTLVSTSAFATVGRISLPEARPHPIQVVEPVQLPRHVLGETVKVTFMLDAEGRPSDVKLASHADDLDLAKSLLPAVAQWKFTPMTQDGQPISHRVMLPIELIAQK